MLFAVTKFKCFLGGKDDSITNMSTDRDIEQATTVNEHPIKPLEKDLTH